VDTRPALAADEDAVWPLARDLATSFAPEREAFGRSYRAILADPHAAVLVAVDAVEGATGRVVGYAHVLTHPAFHANGDIAWIEEVAVDADHRGAGYGRVLMEAAERWARAAGASYVALATRRAAEFYRALDYEESAVYFKKTFARQEGGVNVTTASAGTSG
jgi:GNAT superfamily N-acetyltransferase